MKYHKAKEYLKNACTEEANEEVLRKVKKILEDHPSLIKEDLNGDGWTALIFASIYDNKLILKYLLSLPETNINQQPIDGETALHIAADNDDSERLQWLLSHEKIDVNIQEQYGRTALHLACYKGKVNAVKLLLCHNNININIRENDGFLPRDICCNWSDDKSNQPIILKLLTNQSLSKATRSSSIPFNLLTADELEDDDMKYPKLKKQRLIPPSSTTHPLPIVYTSSGVEDGDGSRWRQYEKKQEELINELNIQVQDLKTSMKEMKRRAKEDRKERRKMEERFEERMNQMEIRYQELERKLEEKKR